MTLTELLEIERKLLLCEDELGFAFAEHLWKDTGMPA
jgi:hypothetical protein